MKHLLYILLIGSFFLDIDKSAFSHEHGGDQAVEEERLQHFKGKHRRVRDHMLKRVDTNEDGKIDLSEYLANAEQRFQSMDLDNDGFVTSEEHAEAGKVMRAKHREMRKKMREERRAKREQQDQTDTSE